ncbi:MAG: hypothetical protein ACPGVD_09010 [Flavobacteriales bacterium]
MHTTFENIKINDYFIHLNRYGQSIKTGFNTLCNINGEKVVDINDKILFDEKHDTVKKWTIE